MNVYEKVQNCRIELQQMNIKKSGKNTFAHYDYYELQDFLPPINLLFQKHKLFSQISFTSEFASLTIVNTENPDEMIHFTSPMAEANLKGTHPIQNLGAVQSYQRRYLYQTALEIVEHDQLDGTFGKDKSTPSSSHTDGQSSTKMISDKQLSLLHSKLDVIAKKRNTTPVAILRQANVTDAKELTSRLASQLIDKLIELETQDT
ncbi:ERF family protein [Peribacillus frigoritolerans]|uniref:ERF family protein n=1 Tax=Peribacillus frigoritolerans TaxID=450367 RepID=UPI0020797B5E|nr:ERF family protein [Peribacillus frigoritolerans]USK78941.1 ERF family protein [Peribacillus frigoritolerans]